MPQAWGAGGGVAALIFLLLFFLAPRTSLQIALLPEHFLSAEPLELVLQVQSHRHIRNNLSLLCVVKRFVRYGVSPPTWTLQIASIQLRPWAALLAWKV